jgi:hypothetical protein
MILGECCCSRLDKFALYLGGTYISMVDISFSLVPFASLFQPSHGSDAAAGVAFGGPDAVELVLPPTNMARRPT